MSPHAALLKLDILEEVFFHLRSRSFRERENSAALARAARVCTSFCGPALKALWWGLPGIGPALRLLVHLGLLRNASTDPLAFRFELDDTQKAGSKGNEVVSSDGWKRFLEYTAHTRFVFRGQAYTISPAVYIYLGYKSGGRSLFPNLRDLIWFSPSANHLELLLLVTPGLPRLEVCWENEGRWPPVPPEPWNRGREGPSALDTLLQTSASRLSRLETLEVKALSHRGPLQEQSWESFAQFHQLRALHIDHSCLVTDTTSLRSLASLSSMSDLRLSVALEVPFPHLDFRGFPSLNTLYVDVSGPMDPRFLNLFDSPGLRSLSLAYLNTPQETISDILNTVATLFPYLRSLSLVTRHGQPSVVPRESVPRPVFETVFGKLLGACAEIEEFTMHLPRGIIVSRAGDAQLELLAHSWPKLRTLSLVVTFSGRITHNSLVTFSRHCPELRTLRLRGVSLLNLTKEKYKVTAPPVPSAHPLEELGVCSARVGDSKLAALFLCHLFPSLRVPDVAWVCPGRCDTPTSDCAMAMATVVRLQDAQRRRKSGKPRALPGGHSEARARREGHSKAADLPSASSSAVKWVVQPHR
ncbi:hypothetical protein C8Q79DRAFT_752829 [Trametes meyenii]|nr:hypothetical protein C8Q79DRAFT_752829 [Trametes meyenii]